MKPTWRIHSYDGVVALGFGLVLLVSGCGGDDGTSSTVASTTTTAPSTTASTTIPPTTQAPTSTATTITVTAAPTTIPTTTAAPTTTAVPTTSLDTNTLAAGSGCTPGTDDLPDGEWFGFVDTASAATIEFDLACWFAGDAAVLAAAEDGEESPPPNDYHVRNANPRLRALSVPADAQVSWLPIVGDPASQETVDYAVWLSGREARGLELQPGVWITMAGGEVAEVHEQYVP